MFTKNGRYVEKKSAQKLKIGFAIPKPESPYDELERAYLAVEEEKKAAKKSLKNKN